MTVSKPKAVAAAADSLIAELAAAPNVRAYAELSIAGTAELVAIMRAVGRLSMALEIYDGRRREWTPALLPLMPEASSTVAPDA